MSETNNQLLVLDDPDSRRAIRRELQAMAVWTDAELGINQGLPVSDTGLYARTLDSIATTEPEGDVRRRLVMNLNPSRVDIANPRLNILADAAVHEHTAGLVRTARMNVRVTSGPTDSDLWATTEFDEVALWGSREIHMPRLSVVQAVGDLATLQTYLTSMENLLAGNTSVEDVRNGVLADMRQTGLSPHAMLSQVPLPERVPVLDELGHRAATSS